MTKNDGEAQAGAAEAAEAEATETAKNSKTVTFGSGDDALTLEVPKKWKRVKFMRALSHGDVGAALEAIWPSSEGPFGQPVPHPSVMALEDLDLDEVEFTEILGQLGTVIGGTSLGNSPASPTS